MAKKILSLLILLISVASLVACAKKEEVKEEVKESFLDAAPTEIDNYFGDKVNLAQTGVTVTDESKFIKDGIAKLDLRSATDGDTLVFNLSNGEQTPSSISPIIKEYSYLTVRFLGVDTPESTSNIEPWGKAASAYVKETLTNANGIIVDATDIEIPEGETMELSTSRRDSSGNRWLALIWYTNDANTDDLTKYRLLQLDLIENCYSGFTGGFDSERYTLEADKEETPKLFSRYEENFGTLTLNEVLYEADIRSQALEMRALGNEIDPNYDYGKDPLKLTVSEALDGYDEYSANVRYVEVTGVITRYVGPNLYIQDAAGKALYIYMGIAGNTNLESEFKVGDTISIRGRLSEYGGAKQMTDVIFKQETFTKVTGNDAIAMPEPIVVPADAKSEWFADHVGELATITVPFKSLGNQSKDLSYSIYTSYLCSSLKRLGDDGGFYDDTFSIRINGSLAPGYLKDYFKGYTKGDMVTVTGLIGVYYVENYAVEDQKYIFPSYQMVVGNVRKDAAKNPIYEITK